MQALITPAPIGSRRGCVRMASPVYPGDAISGAPWGVAVSVKFSRAWATLGLLAGCGVPRRAGSPSRMSTRHWDDWRWITEDEGLARESGIGDGTTEEQD